jgi:hypothetical protein
VTGRTAAVSVTDALRPRLRRREVPARRLHRRLHRRRRSDRRCCLRSARAVALRETASLPDVNRQPVGRQPVCPGAAKELIGRPFPARDPVIRIGWAGGSDRAAATRRRLEGSGYGRLPLAGDLDCGPTADHNDHVRWGWGGVGEHRGPPRRGRGRHRQLRQPSYRSRPGGGGQKEPPVTVRRVVITLVAGSVSLERPSDDRNAADPRPWCCERADGDTPRAWPLTVGGRA